MKAAHDVVSPHIHAFFTEYLAKQKRASPHTVTSCRDTLRLLLTFVQETTGRTPSAVHVSNLTLPLILQFLDHLEQQRGNSVRSRNIRLSVIRALFRTIALRDPSCIAQATQILAIPIKREEKKLVGFLTRAEVEAIVAAPDQACWRGRRDHALLLTLYNTGARVSELTALTPQQLRFGVTSFVQFFGKGRKERTVPLWPRTAQVLQTWLPHAGGTAQSPVFPSIRRTTLSRDGVNHLLQQAVQQALSTCDSLRGRRVTPHLVRHSTAMHLLQAGVDIAVIALWLGHESIETTHVYLESDLLTKERALQKLVPIEVPQGRFTATDPLLRFLATL